MHVDDLADAAVYIMNLKKTVYRKYTKPMLNFINVGSGSDLSIKKLALIIKRTVGFKGQWEFDTKKPDGVSRKLLDSTLLKKIGWRPKIELQIGLKKTYQKFTALDGKYKKYDLLSPSEQRRLYILLLLILIMAFIEMLGVASILPFMAVLTNPELVDSNFLLKYIFEKSKFFGVDTTKKFLFFLGVLVFYFLITSLFLKALTTYVQLRFTLIREYSVGKKLIEHYLNQPYVWFLNKHSADLGKSILSEVNQVINGVMVPTMNLIAQKLGIICNFNFTFFTDPAIGFYNRYNFNW